MHIIKNFLTITHHRLIVMKHCFKVELYWQGITHDLSKYSPTEFFVSAKYFQGNRSPLAKEREVNGYSAGWLHHKGRNKHHFEYWVDFSYKTGTIYVQMPVKYFGEMICDRVAASKIYLKQNYTDASSLEYYNRVSVREQMNENTRACLVYFLTFLKEKGEKAMFKKLKQFIKDNRKNRCYTVEDIK